MVRQMTDDVLIMYETIGFCGLQSLPASQQPSMSAGGGGVTLLHELMGLMRRCLSQTAPIREALYQVCKCTHYHKLQGQAQVSLF